MGSIQIQLVCQFARLALLDITVTCKFQVHLLLALQTQNATWVLSDNLFVPPACTNMNIKMLPALTNTFAVIVQRHTTVELVSRLLSALQAIFVTKALTLYPILPLVSALKAITALRVLLTKFDAPSRL